MKELRARSVAWCLVSVAFGAVTATHAVAQTEILTRFDRSTGGWQGYSGPVRAVPTPSPHGGGALEVTVGLSGRGWSDVTVESPEINRDLTKFKELRISVFAPAGAPSDLRAQVFAKSGPGWTWADGGWLPLSIGQWRVITLPIVEIPNPTQVRAVGVKVGGNSRFNGSVLLDKVELGSSGGNTAPDKISVQILEIVENSRIAGRVFGIPADRTEHYRVVIYVKTDKWYIHPYERGGKGLSFAIINRDGTWQIETVKRAFLADFVAALVVDREYAPPPFVQDLRQLKTLGEPYAEPGRGRL